MQDSTREKIGRYIVFPIQAAVIIAFIVFAEATTRTYKVLRKYRP